MWTQSGKGSGGVNWEKRIDIYILTLCDPVDHSPPGSSVHGILQARTVEWFLCPPPGDLPNPGTGPVSLMSPTLAGRFFTTSAMWEAPLQLAYSNSKAEAECVSNICLKSSDWTPFLLLCP